MTSIVIPVAMRFSRLTIENLYQINKRNLHRYNIVIFYYHELRLNAHCGITYRVEVNF